MFFAFFVFSSCPLEIRYIIHQNITASTAITATYLIPAVITFPMTQYKLVSELGQGRPQQSISGTAAKLCSRYKRNTKNNAIFFIVF